MNDTYKTVNKISEGLYKEKGSKFISYAIPVSSEENIKSHINKLKIEHHNARHHCFAYRLGADKKIYRFNDDNEPSNTAGKPIYGQIESYDLTDILIVVIRYFGGTLLGKGGLINAYRTSAKDAIKNAGIIEKTVHDTYSISCNYENIDTIQRFLNKNNIQVVNSVFDLTCALEVEIAQSQTERVVKQLKSIKNVKLKLLYSS